MGHVVFVGGGHAHLEAIKNLRAFEERGHQATVVSESARHYYSGLGPGLLGGTYAPRQARFDVGKMTEERGGRFVEARAASVDPVGRRVHTESGEVIAYDACSFNTGSRVPAERLNPSVGSNVVPAKPIINLARLRDRLVEQRGVRRRVAVAGGGPAGVEIAGNLRRLARRAGLDLDVVLFSDGALLPRWPNKARLDALSALGRQGVGVREGSRVVRADRGEVKLEDGSSVECDEVVAAVGVAPPDMFRRSGLSTGSQGDMAVNEFMQSVDAPEIFGGGDCVALAGNPLDKVGVYAVRQGPLLLHNLLAALEGGRLRAFDPGGDYLLILNFGDGRGLLHRSGRVLTGRPLFWFKHRLDMAFMRRYQVSGELAPDAL